MAETETMVFKANGKRWKLPQVINTSPDNDVLQRHFYYEILGYRKPKKGEWFLSGAVPEAYKAPNDLSKEYLVIELKEEAVQKTTWTKKGESHEEKV